MFKKCKDKSCDCLL